MDKKTDLVAYCGLYCGGCFGYKGEIADMARDLRKELRKERFDIIARGIPFKEFANYRECYEVLGALVRLRCNSACRGGGGNPFCKIRKCCQKKDIKGCWECDDMETCDKLDSLKVNHGDANPKNLRKLKKKGVEGFLKGKIDWYCEER